MKALPSHTGRSPLEEPYLDQMLRGWWSLTTMRFIPLYLQCRRILDVTSKQSASPRR
jgi:hypothetical protein